MQPGANESRHLTGKPRDLAKPDQRGMTLIELLVALAVMVLLATWAVPSFDALIARNAAATAIMRIKTAVAQARNTAITRRRTISVCASSGPPYTTCHFDDWSQDWVIIDGPAAGGDLTDGTILKVLEAEGAVAVRYNRDDRPVRFSALGWSQGYNGTFTICSDHEDGVSLVLSNTGRLRTSRDAADC